MDLPTIKVNPSWSGVCNVLNEMTLSNTTNRIGHYKDKICTLKFIDIGQYGVLQIQYVEGNHLVTETIDDINKKVIIKVTPTVFKDYAIK